MEKEGKMKKAIFIIIAVMTAIAINGCSGVRPQIRLAAQTNISFPVVYAAQVVVYNSAKNIVLAPELNGAEYKIYYKEKETVEANGEKTEKEVEKEIRLEIGFGQSACCFLGKNYSSYYMTDNFALHIYERKKKGGQKKDEDLEDLGYAAFTITKYPYQDTNARINFGAEQLKQFKEGKVDFQNWLHN